MRPSVVVAPPATHSIHPWSIWAVVQFATFLWKRGNWRVMYATLKGRISMVVHTDEPKFASRVSHGNTGGFKSHLGDLAKTLTAPSHWPKCNTKNKLKALVGVLTPTADPVKPFCRHTLYSNALNLERKPEIPQKLRGRFSVCPKGNFLLHPCSVIPSAFSSERYHSSTSQGTSPGGQVLCCRCDLICISH